MWAWFFGHKPQRDLMPLRAYFVHNECDLAGALPSEDDFTLWLESLDEADLDFYADLGAIQLSRLDGGDGEAGDIFDTLDLAELRPVWHSYQRANQSWGVLSWAARAYGWLHGLWF